MTLELDSFRKCQVLFRFEIMELAKFGRIEDPEGVLGSFPCGIPSSGFSMLLTMVALRCNLCYLLLHSHPRLECLLLLST